MRWGCVQLKTYINFKLPKVSGTETELKSVIVCIHSYSKTVPPELNLTSVRTLEFLKE
jgi:hypothetical protein